MDSSWMAVRHRCAKLSLVSQLKPFQKESTHELTNRTNTRLQPNRC